MKFSSLRVPVPPPTLGLAVLLMMMAAVVDGFCPTGRIHRHPPFLHSTASDEMDWSQHWYPVAAVQDLEHDKPTKITLLGMDFAVWYHKDSKEWKAFRDECPHRLVPLSEGRVEPDVGVLQCAYHGWEFDASGACVRIPQVASAAAVASPRACATVFPTQVAQELLWIFPTADEAAAANAPGPALIPEIDDDSFVDATQAFTRDVPYSWDVLVENLLDPSHVDFAHHGYIPDASRNKEDHSLDLEVIKDSMTRDGFVAQKARTATTVVQEMENENDDNKDVASKGRFEVEEDSPYRVQFRPPCLLYYQMGDQTDPTATFLGLGQYCIPTAPGQSRLIARFPFRLNIKPAMVAIRNTPRWINHFGQNIVLDSDVVFLASQDERLATNRRQPNYYLPAKSDAMVSAFRSWLGDFGRGGPAWLGIPTQRSGGGAFPNARVPAGVGREALLDRYRQHTLVCASCRKAHTVLTRLKEACLYLGVSLIAAAAGMGTVGRTDMAIWRRMFAAMGGLLVLAPRVLLHPLVARLECMPWPRKDWQKPTAQLMAMRSKQLKGY